MSQTVLMELEPALPCKVADMSLAEWGLKEMQLAENEMPGLMAVRAKYGPEQPLKGLKVMGSLHMTIQTAMLIDTLHALGADIRWATCNIFSTLACLKMARWSSIPSQRPILVLMWLQIMPLPLSAMNAINPFL